MMTLKGAPYTKLFSTSSEVILMSCILSQLNILCNNLIKPYFTKMTTHPLFTVHMLRPFQAFSNVLDLIRAEQSIDQNVQYFIWSKNSVSNFTAVRYSLHKCSKTIVWLKGQFTIHVSPVCCALKFTEARKTCSWVVRTSIWSILYSLQQKLYRQDFRDVHRLTLILLQCWSDKSDAIEGVPDKLLKGSALVFRVHSRHVELLLTYWCSQSTMIVNFEATVCNNWTSCLN